jgi:uncharacterized protein YdaU (DUF1376 family)
MTARSPDFKMDFYVKDFLTSTATWTGSEVGAYAHLLILAWTQGAALPADPERIRTSCRYTPGEWKRLWVTLAPKFPLTPDGTARRNPREVERWNEESVRVSKASEHGKKGAGGRWGGESSEDPLSNAQVIPEHMPEHMPEVTPSPSPSPSSSPSEKEELGAGPPSRSSAEDGAAASLFERLRKEAGGEDFFEEFMAEEKYRIARELMQERPAVFEKISIEDLATLWQGGTLRGTKHDRKALLLWARDPEGFHVGGALSGPTKRDRKAAAIHEGGPW